MSTKSKLDPSGRAGAAQNQGLGSRVLVEAVFQPTQLRHQWILLPPTPSTGPDTARRRSLEKITCFAIRTDCLMQVWRRKGWDGLVRACAGAVGLVWGWHERDWRMASLVHRIVMGIQAQTQTGTSTFEQDGLYITQAEWERALPGFVIY